MNNREAHFYLEELQRMMTQHRGIFSEEFVCANGLAIQALERIQSVDAVPVKHGRWIAMSDADGIYWACSECGEDIPRISHYNSQFDLFPRLESIDKTNFCPNCGASMDWERKENEG